MNPSTLFFSYAWGDEQEEAGKSREAIVNALYESLEKDGYSLIRDKVHLGYKGFISDFMKQIGKGNRIIVVMSDKYVRSPFCMYELYEIARNSKFEKAIFRERVFPILVEFIDFAKPAIIETYLEYWEKQEKEWESLFQKRMGKLSSEQYNRYEKVKLISQNIAQLMDWLIDMNTLNPKLLAENDFEIIKKELQKSLDENSQLLSHTESSKQNTTMTYKEFKEFLSAKPITEAFDILDQYHEQMSSDAKTAYSQIKREHIYAATPEYMLKDRLLMIAKKYLA